MTEQSNDDLLNELDDLLGPGSSAQPLPKNTSEGPYAVHPTMILTAAPPQESQQPVIVPDPVKDTGGASATAPAPAKPAAPASKKILIVDDSKDYRDVVHYLLKEKGYEVETAEDGAEGMVKALQTRPDLILVDFNMPGVNGYELIQEIRGNDELRRTPIVMFTGARNRHQLREMGLDIQGFLDKPISNSKLLGSIAKILKPPAAEEAQQTFEIVTAPQDSTPTDSEAPEPIVAAPEEEEDEFEVKLPEGMPSLEELEGPNLNDNEELLVDIEKESDTPGEEEAGLEDVANDSPLVNRVNKILVRAVGMGASDIHIEPQEHEITVRLRLNGSLKHLCSFPSSLGPRIAARIKIMSDLVITERRRPQDGQFRATINDAKVEFRVSIIPSMNGEKIVMRILGGNKLKSDLDSLGFNELESENVTKALKSSNGLILVTGPTGSGKTTTLYTMISTINNPDVNVMTAEDPVEYRLPGITQVPVRAGIGLTFESVLRAFLRQDPDIMLIGEIRDLETAEIAIKASITGHLVLSTLHTNSAPATITRLTHMGVAPFLVAASVKLIVAQRLLKVLCTSCKLQVPLSDEDKKILTEEEADKLQDIFRGVGCRDCNQTGYTTRMPIFEVMPITSSEMRTLILAGASIDDLTAQAVKEGMVTLRQAALNVVAGGYTSLPEAMKIILSG